jgi:polyhydroxyalkanoate depolymerase
MPNPIQRISAMRHFQEEHCMPDPIPSTLPDSPGYPPGLREFALMLETAWGDRLRLPREIFGLDGMPLNASDQVREEIVVDAPFGRLLRFGGGGNERTRVLLAAPMAGHGSAQLREMVADLLPQFDVYVTDWRDARDVPLAEGGFGLDDHIDYLLRFCAEVGPGAHLIAVCQSCVPSLAAASLMAEDGHPARPRSLTLIAGPVDAAVNPGAVNRFATGAPLSWFEQQLISIVPDHAPGAGRRVYGGAMQLITAAAMEHQRCMASLWSSLFDPSAYCQALLGFGNALSFQQPVLDLAAELYLDNLREVFQHCALARGSLRHRDRPVRPQAIRDTLLLTVEGELDEICGPGQTAAAHRLCSGIGDAGKRHLAAIGARHRDVFSGDCWRLQVLPEVLATLNAGAGKSNSASCKGVTASGVPDRRNASRLR